MKQKLFFALFICMLLPASLFAQVVAEEDDTTKTIVEETEADGGKIVTTTSFEKQYVFADGLWQNWEFLAGVGTHAYLGDNDWKVRDLVEMITLPVFDLGVTKWVSPKFGIGVSASTGRFKGLYQSSYSMWGENAILANFMTDTPYNDADPKYDYQELRRQWGWFTNVYGLVHLDVLNIIHGYKPDRPYTLDAYFGGGLMMGRDEHGFLPSASANFGLINKFRLTDGLSLFASVRGALVADDFDGELYIEEPSKWHWDYNIKMDGNVGVTVGLTMNLGKVKEKWIPASRSSKYVKDPSIDLDADFATDNDPSKERIVETVEVIKTNIPTVWFHINFIIDRWDLLSREMVNLHAISDLIKSTPDVKYLICGYADKQTATPAHNMMLSENRTKAVYDALVNVFGVNPDQLIRDYKGGVDYMFYNEKELSRCVMITSVRPEE
jgi:outer membrane protein OmpA-like peptidoglycan-associated protein